MSATAARSPTPTARSTSRTARWSSTTARRTRRSTLFREMARVARLGVVVNDLDRRRLGWVGAWLIGHLLTRNRYTRHDAPLSVRRAYRPDEMAAMLRDAGLTPVRTIRGAFGSATRSRRCRLRMRPIRARRPTRRAPASDRGTGRRRDRRRRAGGRGPRARLARAGHRRRRLRAVAGVALACRWRLRLAGRGHGARAGRPGRRRRSPRSPGRSPRCASRPRRDRVPPDLRHRDRRAAGGRLRPIATRPGAARPRDECRRGRPARLARRGRRPRRRGRLEVRDPDGATRHVRAGVVVGADGPHSVVARAAGVARAGRLAPRIGLTYHLADPDPTAIRDARMRVLRDGYVGIAPVAGGRVNVGIVLGRSWREALARDGARAVAAGIVAAIPPTADDPAAWRARRPARHGRRRLAARSPRDPSRRPRLAARR